MDDPISLQLEPWRRNKLTDFTSPKRPAVRLKFNPSSPMNRSTHAAAAKQTRVSRVDDDINLLMLDPTDFGEDTSQGRGLVCSSDSRSS